jgi:hypothetical protein
MTTKDQLATYTIGAGADLFTRGIYLRDGPAVVMHCRICGAAVVVEQGAKIDRPSLHAEYHNRRGELRYVIDCFEHGRGSKAIRTKSALHGDWVYNCEECAKSAMTAIEDFDSFGTLNGDPE